MFMDTMNSSTISKVLLCSVSLVSAIINIELYIFHKNNAHVQQYCENNLQVVFSYYALASTRTHTNSYLEHTLSVVLFSLLVGKGIKNVLFCEQKLHLYYHGCTSEKHDKIG